MTHTDFTDPRWTLGLLLHITPDLPIFIFQDVYISIESHFGAFSISQHRTIALDLSRCQNLTLCVSYACVCVCVWVCYFSITSWSWPFFVYQCIRTQQAFPNDVSVVDLLIHFKTYNNNNKNSIFWNFQWMKRFYLECSSNSLQKRRK